MKTLPRICSEDLDIFYEQNRDLVELGVVQHPRFMFHYSPISNRDSIQSLGLLKNPQRGRIWDVQDEGVFLFANPLLAWAWQNDVRDNIVDYKPSTLFWDTEEDEGLQGDIWIVDTLGLNTRYDDFLRKAICVSDNVPVGSITRTDEDTKESLDIMYEDYVNRCMKLTIEEEQNLFDMFADILASLV